MDNEINEIKEKIRQKRINATNFVESKKAGHPFFYKYLSKFLIMIIITLITLIGLKSNTQFRNLFYKHVYDTNFSFASVNEVYQKYFGSPIPFKDLFKDVTTPVFNEKLKYQEVHKYRDGAKLVVESNYLVPALKKGIVIFIGDKDDYKNTVIIQQSDGVDVWYSNITNINVKLYDYITDGGLVGETIDNNLYLVFKKDGTNLDYKKHI